MYDLVVEEYEWSSLMDMSQVCVPARYFSRRSQMERLEYGSTPDVGSSRNTTLAPPTKAMATESFLCIPPT